MGSLTSQLFTVLILGALRYHAIGTLKWRKMGRKWANIAKNDIQLSKNYLHALTGK